MIRWENSIIKFTNRKHFIYSLLDTNQIEPIDKPFHSPPSITELIFYIKNIQTTTTMQISFQSWILLYIQIYFVYTTNIKNLVKTHVY